MALREVAAGEALDWATGPETGGDGGEVGSNTQVSARKKTRANLGHQLSFASILPNL